MELLDIIVYSFSQSNKLYTLLKKVFPPNKFALYKITEKVLFDKSWYNSFRFLVIDDYPTVCHDQIMKIIGTVLYDRKQSIVISEKVEPELLKQILKDDMNIEFINRNVTIVKESGIAYALIYNNFDSFVKYYNMISELWNIDRTSNIDISLIHSNVFAFACSRERKVQYLLNLRLRNVYDDSKVQFQYNNQNFIVHTSENSIVNDSDYKILTSVNKTNDKLGEIISFKKEDYFSALYTKSLGKVILFAEVLSSSFDLMEKLVELENYQPLVIISYVQTKGKGRGDNKWISPLGCAMFTCLVPIAVKSKLGNLVSLIQHIMAVSIVEALNFICWIDDKALKIKWPNDIYWNKRGKISGVLLKSVMNCDKFYFMIGCGINVSNKDPTVCVYDIIMEHNKEIEFSKISYPSIEQIIGHVITRLESNILEIQNNQHPGIESFKEKYYKYWMHSDQIVTYKNNENKEFSGRIIGINDYGFLQICSSDQSVITLHPDGNTFDMMHDLITTK